MRIRLKPLAFVVPAAGVILAFQNCAPKQVQFADAPVQESLTNATGSEVTTPTPLPVATPPGTVICDPFTKSTSAGLKAHLWYYDQADGRTAINNLNDMFTKGTEVKDTLILFGKVNVPTISFEKGFTAGSGDKLKNSAGEDLVEWFGLKFTSNVQLADDESEGYYQMATLSDDGSILKVDQGSGLETVVNNDGWTATRFVCGSVVHIKKGQKLPMELQYFQGPRTAIALNVMWRKVNASTVLMPSYCGSAADFFELDGPPMEKYRQLESDGWKVLKESNYSLEEIIPNNCNQ